MTTAPKAWRAGLTASALAATSPLWPVAVQRWAQSQQTTVAAGFSWLVVSALVPLLVPRGSRAGIVKYTIAGVLWGAATVVAGSFPHALLGPYPLPHVAVTVGLLGMVAIAVQQLRCARASDEDSPLLVETGLLATVIAAVCWDAVARAGLVLDSWCAVSASGVIVTASFIAASTLVLAVQHTKLRLPGAGLAAGALGSAVSAIAAGSHPVVGDVALLVGSLGMATLVVAQPRGGPVRGVEAPAATTAHRLRLASVVAVVVLLGDVALNVASPRADAVAYLYIGAIVVAVAARQAAAGRAIERTHTRLSVQALHDPLTKLQNRSALQRALHQPGPARSLVLLELRGLDDITDVLGVSVGEDVLRAAAANLREQTAPLGGRTFRVRHDEFAVLLPFPLEQAVRHVPAVFAAISAAPLQVSGTGRFPVTAIAGVAGVSAEPPRGASGDAMTPLVEADIALRDARGGAAAGGAKFSVYSGKVADGHARRLLLRERLALAVAEGTVDVHYQPIVNFSTGRVEKFEALARWEDAELGRISPVEFIAVAEESNLVVALGEHVLRRAVGSADAAGVFAAGVKLAVNVSVVQLQSPGFADVVREILAQYRIPPQLLTLELTESVFLDNDSPAERVVTELAGLGCQIAIDDFGTGYSAFGYLDRLPVHVLKVDRSLTQSLTATGPGRSVVTAVVDLANRLGLTVVVEGVETAEEAAICRSIEAGLGQGWLYSAAVTSDAIVAELGRTYPVSPEPVH